MRGRERQMLSPSLGSKLETFPAAAPAPLLRCCFVVFYVGFMIFWSSKFPSLRVLRWFHRIFFGSGPFLLDFQLGFHIPYSQFVVFYVRFWSVPHRLSCFCGGFGNVLDSNV